MFNRVRLIKPKSMQEGVQLHLQINFQGGLRPLFFYVIIHAVSSVLMERDKLKLIVKNLELLVDALKTEVYADKEAYKIEFQQDAKKFGFDYSNDDDDGYPD